MKFATTATVVAVALAIFTDPTQARIGGFNGAAAQAAAMVISGFNGGQLNGPSSGPARVNIRNGPAPIVRVIRDEDDLLGGFRNPVYANNREHNAREGYTSVPAGGRYDSAFYKRHHDPNYYKDTDDDLLGTNHGAQNLKRCTRSCDRMQCKKVARVGNFDTYCHNHYNCKANCFQKAGHTTDDDLLRTNYGAQYLKFCNRKCDFINMCKNENFKGPIHMMCHNHYNCKANCVLKAGQLSNRL